MLATPALQEAEYALRGAEDGEGRRTRTGLGWAAALRALWGTDEFLDSTPQRGQIWQDSHLGRRSAAGSDMARQPFGSQVRSGVGHGEPAIHCDLDTNLRPDTLVSGAVDTHRRSGGRQTDRSETGSQRRKCLLRGRLAARSTALAALRFWWQLEQRRGAGIPRRSSAVQSASA